MQFVYKKNLLINMDFISIIYLKNKLKKKFNNIEYNHFI